ncbi:HepT-like ribonuclease domain-containing protein [Ancylobacter sp.]|uniref:HepT-like ribonuclease domain-containing protein n=1 Tax=Ancylobacter sp. TaxID=1872567 RepID=UPI003D0FD031
MEERALFRLQDMKASIENIRNLLDGRSFDAMYGDAATRAAFERFLEILSEASRHVPGEWKSANAPSIPWKQIADLGNHIRHAYHKLDAQLLWNIYENDLDKLDEAVRSMLARHGADR